LAAGADTTLCTYAGRTALHCAAAIGSERVLRQLLRRNADVTAVDNEGWQPLHHAAANGHTNICAPLVLAGSYRLID